MIFIIIWAQCGSFAAIYGVIQCGSVAVDGMEKVVVVVR
jgi:hypothetical protein